MLRFIIQLAYSRKRRGCIAQTPSKVAERLTFQTLEGAVAMLKETQQSPKELREMVTSPGGTTLAGLTRLERGQFFQTVRAAVEAATRRSRELGRG